MNSPSFVHFQNGQIRAASNDGMEILGHFLLTQVGAKADFFVELLKDQRDRELSAGPYFVQTIGDAVNISHLENELIMPFETSRANMLDILHRWEGFCGNQASSACNPHGFDVRLIRGVDDDWFTFETGAA